MKMFRFSTRRHRQSRVLPSILFMMFGAFLFDGGCPAFAQPHGAMLPAPLKPPRAAMICLGCHSVNPRENFGAPTLHGVFGRRAGSISGYTYSSAMKHADIVWTEANLNAYLTKPQMKVPGNQMAFGGIQDPRQRAAVIAYLKSLSIH